MWALLNHFPLISVDTTDKLFISGGFTNVRLANSEVVDLSGFNRACPSPPSTPFPLWYPLKGIKTNRGEPLFCGGQKPGGEFSAHCYRFDKETKNWIYTAPFYQGTGASSVQLRNGSYWILGGTVNNTVSYTYNDKEGSMTRGPDLKEEHVYNCALQISPDETLMINSKVYVLNHATNTWSELGTFNWESTNANRRWQHSICGIVYDKNGDLDYVCGHRRGRIQSHFHTDSRS